MGCTLVESGISKLGKLFNEISETGAGVSHDFFVVCWLLVPEPTPTLSYIPQFIYPSSTITVSGSGTRESEKIWNMTYV